MAVDRPLALRNAEQLLRQGKLDRAIAEYLRVVEDQPQDWNTANLLGDLYIRAGQSDKAVAQYCRIADSLSLQGFWPKAAALYKKIIKIRPDDEHALLQAGEMAAQQGVLVDARTYLNTVAERRLARGDRHGATAVRIRLAALDPSDFDARRAAARARAAIGDLPGAMRDFKAIAADLADRGRQAETVAALREAADLDPGDQAVLEQLFTLCLAAGDLESAAARAATPAHFLALAQAHLDRGEIDAASRFLPAETGTDPAQMLKLAEATLLSGARDEGLSLFRSLLNQEPGRSHEVALRGCEIARSAPDAGFAVVEIAAETSVIEGDWPAAAAVLHEFIARIPTHLPALMRLVEICVDGGLDPMLKAAESQLADAYLAAGIGAEARVIAEDLIARDPSERSHVDQLRLALVMLGEPDPDRLIAERLGRAALDGASSDLPTGSGPDDEVAHDSSVRHAADAAVDTGRSPSDGTDADAVSDAIEIDLSDLLSDLTAASSMPAGSPQAGIEPDEPGDLDAVFEQFRDQASRGSGQDEAGAEYERGVALRDEGRLDESLLAFKTASREPRLRFRAAAAVARLHSQRGDMTQAVEWLEQAAQAPAPTAVEAYSLLYELAETLESLGEVERALAICLELQTEAGDYRDVAVRISRLARVQTRG